MTPNQQEMDPAVDQQDRVQKKAFFETLRDFYTGRDKRSEEVFTAFQADPEAHRAELAALLDHYLPEDQALLARQIEQAMGPEGSQFVNLVTGGNVGQIVNIAQTGAVVLKIDSRRYFYVFRNVPQVIAFLVILVLVGAAVAAGYWWSQQPRMMTGDFNIAVAEFEEKSLSESDTGVAAVISQDIASFLTEEYQAISFEAVQVAHDKIGIIHEAEQARKLAEKINADLVIYGDVTVIDDQAQVNPQFYVQEPYRQDAGEIGGQHKLTLPINFPVADLLTPASDVHTDLRRRTAILTEFTKGLTYRATGNLLLAAEAMDEAIDTADGYGDFGGKEVIYMLASDVARLQEAYDQAQQYVDEALHLNQEYGRAYIAQANLYYDQGDFFQARKAYEQALALEDQPFGAYVAEKAHIGLGNIYTFQFQEMRGNDQATDDERVSVANAALEHYQAVIDTYRQSSNPEERLREMAAWSYYGGAIVYQVTGRFAEAEEALLQARQITKDDELIERVERRLAEVRSQQ